MSRQAICPLMRASLYQSAENIVNDIEANYLDRLSSK